MIQRVKRFYTNQERCHLDIYRYGAGPAVTDRIHNTGQNVYNLLFKQEVAATPVTSIFSFLSHPSRRALFIRTVE
jgi:hypothetical protein